MLKWVNMRGGWKVMHSFMWHKYKTSHRAARGAILFSLQTYAKNWWILFICCLSVVVVRVSSMSAALSHLKQHNVIEFLTAEKVNLSDILSSFTSCLSWWNCWSVNRWVIKFHASGAGKVNGWPVCITDEKHWMQADELIQSDCQIMQQCTATQLDKLKKKWVVYII